ncbi:uncharacterized protein LOC110736065 [Chenopodium quinoa]|uniref:Uncharacterized protein n=1 Tax=Chenopodium quinoa TaxID=63459 RepID=A0A803KPC8_CHEQI|nr:uncharacterized protein LOC110736065 [Chenopodium quinoa]
MGEGKVVVFIVVGFLGLAAAALAFAAEATKIKVSDISITEFNTCEYPSSPANILGYTAALLTFIAQITISIVARCACLPSDSNSQSPGVTFAFILSWVGSVIGIGLLVYAANLSTRQEFLGSIGLCYTLKTGLFASGGVLALLACILGMSSSYSFSTNRRSSIAVPYHGGIAMANSQFADAPT